MKQRWTEEELVESWALNHSEQQLLSQRTDRGRLSYAVLIKFFQFEGRFPTYNKEVPAVAVEFLAEQLNLPVSLWLDFSLNGRSSERARAEIRTFLGFRSATVDDGHQIQAWLLDEVVPNDQDPRHLKAAVLDWCRKNRIEPPTSERIDRIIRAAIRQFEQHFFEIIHKRLSLHNQQQLDALLSATALNEHESDFGSEADIPSFSKLKTDPGRIGLNSILKEITKLKRIEAVQLPSNLFDDVSTTTLERLRMRVSTESLQYLQRHPPEIRYTLLAAFCWQRRKTLIDGLIELFMQIVHRVSVSAEKKVVTEIIGDLEKVHGKNTLLYRLAKAAMEQPDGIVKDVLFPVCGKEKLEALVKEYHSKGPVYRRHVHTLLRSSYSHHYRRMLPLILDTLTFCSNNQDHQPVIRALHWLKENYNSRKRYIDAEAVPIDGVVRPQLQDLFVPIAS